MTTKIKHINPAVTPTLAGIVATSVSQFTDVNIPDNNSVRFGDSQDLQIYHDGTDSFITNNTGILNITNNDIRFKTSGAETSLRAVANGAVELMYDNSTKLATDAQGINITGGIDVADITATGNVSLNSDNGTLYFGAGADMRLYHDGYNSYIGDSGTGALKLTASEFHVMKYGAAEYMIHAAQDGAVTLYHNNSPRVSTSTAGATVTGTLTVTGDLDITGNVNSTSVTDLDVTDKTITVGAGQTEANSGGSGLIVDGSNASILWDETSDEWDFNKGISIVKNGGANLFLNDSNGRTIRLRTANSGSQNSNISSYAGLYLGGSDNANHMLINGSGNVKIGSSSVSGARLSVTGTSSGSNNPGIFQIGTDTTMGTGTNMMTMGVDNDSHVWIQGTKPGHDSRNIVLQPGGLVNANAYVGIGVTDPSAALHIQTATSDTNSAVPSIMITNLSSGTTTTGFGGEIRFQAERNNGVNQNTGGIRSVAEVNAGTNISSGLAFDVGTAGVNDEALRIKYNGNVGIGTATPTARMHVTSNSYPETQEVLARFTGGVADYQDNRYVLIENTFTGAGYYSPALVFKTNANGSNQKSFGSIVLSAAGDLSFQTKAAGSDVAIGTDLGTTQRMIIESGGNVGIGTNNPNSRLHVKSSGTGNVLYVESSDGHHLGGFYQESDTRAAFNVRDASGSVKVNLDAGGDSWFTGGDVGIGTSNPSYKLDVYGTDDITMRIHRPSSGLALTDTCGIGFSHRGDANTSSSDTRAGIFSTYNGSLHLSTEPGGNLNSNPVDHAALSIIGTDQNVGIGTTTPQAKLAVNTPLTNASADLRAIDIVVPGSWSNSGNAGHTSDITWTNSTGSGYVMGKFGLRYAGTSTSGNSEFVFKDMYQGGFGSSADIMYLGSNGRVQIPGSMSVGGTSSAVGIGGAMADANTVEVGPGYVNLARDDTAAARQLQFSKNGSQHSYIDTSTAAMEIGAASGLRTRILGNGNTVFQAGSDRLFSIGAGTYTQGKIRQYVYQASVANGVTIDLFGNTSAHTDIHYIMTLEAFHSGRSYRFSSGSIGGYGWYGTHTGTGINFNNATVATGRQKLNWTNGTGFTAAVYISALIFGDSGVDVYNGAISEAV